MTFTDELTALEVQEALGMAAAEVGRSQEKFGFQELTLAEWFCILAEEVGEVATEVNEIRLTPDRGLKEIKKELIQVAAMAAKMWAAIESGTEKFNKELTQPF